MRQGSQYLIAGAIIILPTPFGLRCFSEYKCKIQVSRQPDAGSARIYNRGIKEAAKIRRRPVTFSFAFRLKTPQDARFQTGKLPDLRFRNFGYRLVVARYWITPFPERTDDR